MPNDFHRYPHAATGHYSTLHNGHDVSVGRQSCNLHWPTTACRDREFSIICWRADLLGNRCLVNTDSRSLVLSCGMHLQQPYDKGYRYHLHGFDYGSSNYAQQWHGHIANHGSKTVRHQAAAIHRFYHFHSVSHCTSLVWQPAAYKIWSDTSTNPVELLGDRMYAPGQKILRPHSFHTSTKAKPQQVQTTRLQVRQSIDQ